jgi:hypothetical protein
VNAHEAAPLELAEPRLDVPVEADTIAVTALGLLQPPDVLLGQFRQLFPPRDVGEHVVRPQPVVPAALGVNRRPDHGVPVVSLDDLHASSVIAAQIKGDLDYLGTWHPAAQTRVARRA